MKWSEEKQPNDVCRYNHIETHCPILGTIRIEWKGYKSHPSFDCIIINNDGNIIIDAYEPDLESAKKSVETQYKDLVRKITDFNFERDKYIELVKKWLANPESVTQQELEENAEAAWAAVKAADRAAYEDVDWSAKEASYRAVYEAAQCVVEEAKIWVEKYEALVNN